MTPDQQAGLREALAEVARLNDPSFDDYTFVMNAGDAKVLADAARWALDLIEGGKKVWWCEVGKATKLSRNACIVYRHTECGKRLLVAL